VEEFEHGQLAAGRAVQLDNLDGLGGREGGTHREGVSDTSTYFQESLVGESLPNMSFYDHTHFLFHARAMKY